MEDDLDSVYNAEYYRHYRGSVPYTRSNHWLEFFRTIAARTVLQLAPRRVLDAGCAWGMLVEAFRDCGVEAWGIDVSHYAISQVRADLRPYCRVGSLTEPIDGSFDLITCIEVLEHLTPEDARLAVKQLTRATDTLLFSSTPDVFDEPTHQNVQPILSWINLFAEYGFAPDIGFDAGFIAPHAFLLRRAEKSAPEEMVRLFCEKLQIQCELAMRRSDVERLQQKAEHLENQLGQAQIEIAAASNEIARVYSSPAWAIISRYRGWLTGHQLRNSLVWRLYEPAARGALRLAGLLHPAPSLPDAGDPSSYHEWCSRVEPADTQLAWQREFAAQLSYRPLISVLVPVFRVPLPIVKAMVESVLTQTYDYWELCIAHGAPEDAEVRGYLTRIGDQEPRIKLKLLQQNHGISGNSNEALSLVAGEFVALLDHDDTLAPFALFEIARALNSDPTLDFIYSDRDEINESGSKRLSPLFKPDWSPEMLLSANYLTHLTVLRTERVRAIGGWRQETDGAQDWDLFLRFITKDVRIHHIPMMLYHWRKTETSVAAQGLAAKPYAAEAQLVSIRDHLSRVKSMAEVDHAGDGFFRLKWGAGPRMSVSIVVVQQDSLSRTIAFAEEALEQSRDALELVISCTEAGNSKDKRIRFVTADPEASVAARLNLAVAASRGEALIFLDENVRIQDKEWIAELTGPLENPDIGIVGAKLIDSQTDLIRHAGLVFGADGNLESVFAGEPEQIISIFGTANWYRNWLAVSGACFSIRRETLLKIGQFREDPEYPRLDIDLCLRVRFQTGRRVLFNPFARLLQDKTGILEWPLFLRAPRDAAASMRLWFEAGDPYFNRNLACKGGRITLNYQSLTAQEPQDPFSLKAREAVSAHDFTSSMLEASKRASSQPGQRRLKTIVWFVPELTNPFYGGIHTILRFADYFRASRNVESRFAVLGGGSTKTFRAFLAKAFPELAAASEITMLRRQSEAHDQAPCDAAVATFWTTAFPVLAFNGARRKFYFLQDYEPLFYPAGSASALAESTLRFGFVGLCNTIALRDLYREQGGEGEYFSPCVDTSIFHAIGRKNNSNGPYNVFLYARPTAPRNCFELASAAMAILKRRLGDAVRIVAAGSNWDASSYRLDGIVENLGLLDYRLTGPLYRTCDAGVSLMMTSHPSYPPLELMACGALVVSNRNPRTAWFFKDRVNCLLAENSSSALADAVEEGLQNRVLRKDITERAADTIAKHHSQWDLQAEKIYQYMLSCC